MDKFPLQINKKFRFCQHKKSVESDASFRWANNNRKRVLNVRLVYANKTREPISYHKRGSHNFWQNTNNAGSKNRVLRPRCYPNS